jgi:hypothetical protein
MKITAFWCQRFLVLLYLQLDSAAAAAAVVSSS